MKKAKTPSATTYGNWTVLGVAPGRQMLLCRCACGTQKSVYKYNLTAGKTKSCGCFPAPGPVTHGLSKHPDYDLWQGMKARCYQKGHKNYADYGGRGIKVCDRWVNDFAAFNADMGDRPSKAHSLDRIKNDKDYEPGNCKWSTQKQQTRNTRRSTTITIDGISKTVAEWCELHGIPSSRVYHRLKAGKTGRDALFAKPWSLAAYVNK